MGRDEMEREEQRAEQPERPAHCQGRRRIWELDPATLRMVLGPLFEHHELVMLFQGVGRKLDGMREECLLDEAVESCREQSPFAEAVELLLAERARKVRADPGGAAVCELAGTWAAGRQAGGGPWLASFLWCLACDPRPELDPLTRRVAGTLSARGLRSLGR